MAATAEPWRAVPGGLAVFVRVTPKSSRDAVEGIEARGDVSAVKIRVRAVPEDGKANAAVAELLARFLDLPKRAASVTGGLAAREKTVTLTGDAAVIAQDLARRLKDQPA